MGGRLGAIALLAMLVRAVMPAGYMIAEADTAHGRYLTVQMCEGHLEARQVIDLDTGKQVDVSKLPGKAKDIKSAPCVFASVAPLAAPVVSAEPVEFVTSYDVDFGIARDVRPGRGIPAPPPPSTGPPSIL